LTELEGQLQRHRHPDRWREDWQKLGTRWHSAENLGTIFFVVI
jgi:hypothetical protein